MGQNTVETEDDDENSRVRSPLGKSDIKRELYLRECRKLGVIPVGSYLRAIERTDLVLRHYCIGPSGAQALAVPLMLDPCLTCLDLEGNCIGALGFRSLAETLSENASLTYLNLSSNAIGGDGGAAWVCDVIKSHKSLVAVNLSSNGFADSEGAFFSDLLKTSKTLRELNLSHNNLDDKSGPAVGDGLAVNDCLEVLDLSWNQFRGKSAVGLCKGLKENVRLKKLNLSHNGFGAVGLHAVSDALAANSSLVELDISSNRIVGVYNSVEEARKLTSKLATNDTLSVLKLGDNPLTPIACLAFLMTIQKAENCAIRYLDLTLVAVSPEFMEVLADIQTLKPLSVVTGGVMKCRVLKDNRQKPERDDASVPPPNLLVTTATFVRSVGRLEEEGDDDTAVNSPDTTGDTVGVNKTALRDTATEHRNLGSPAAVVPIDAETPTTTDDA